MPTPVPFIEDADDADAGGVQPDGEVDARDSAAHRSPRAQLLEQTQVVTLGKQPRVLAVKWKTRKR